MNFREILENNKINIFTTIFQKIVILKKIGLVDFFGDFLSHFIYLCLRFKQNISFENFVQNTDYSLCQCFYNYRLKIKIKD